MAPAGAGTKGAKYTGSAGVIGGVGTEGVSMHIVRHGGRQTMREYRRCTSSGDHGHTTGPKFSSSSDTSAVVMISSPSKSPNGLPTSPM